MSALLILGSIVAGVVVVAVLVGMAIVGLYGRDRAEHERRLDAMVIIPEKRN